MADEIDLDYVGGPATLGDNVSAALRGAAVLAAAVPTTTVPPVLWSWLWYRRFEDEERLLARHRMCDWAAFCVRHIIRADLRVLDLDRIPRERPGLMAVSNHQSYVDIPMIMGGLRLGAFLSKQLVAYIPFLGICAYLSGTVYLRRSSPESRKEALDETLRMCAESTPVVVFPEGTRSRDGNLRETIQPGALRGAFDRGLKVVTFGLDGTGKIFPPTMDRVRLGQRVVVAVGSTFDPRDFPDAEAFVTATWSGVRESFLRARAARDSAVWPPPGSTKI
jgi:1-acyl-sn-glycerol-3-phosphate acyltransferase